MARIDFSSAALPSSGDNDPSQVGLTVSGRTNQTVLTNSGQDELAVGSVVAPQMQGTVAGHVVPWWLALIVLVIAVKFIAEKNDEAGEFKNIRVGFFNIMVITLCAVIGLTLLKWIFGIYKVPGIAPLIEAA